MKKAIFVAAAVILTAALAFSGFKLWAYFSAEQEAAEQYGSLTEQVVTPPSIPDGTEQPDDSPPSEWTVNDQYGTLFEQNPDMIGWIKIDGTTIDYPVMQTPDRPDYYLKRGFDGKTSDYGVPYAAGGCSIDPQSGNITIFGHHMKSGKMFGILESYKSEAFWREHPHIQFDTRAGFGKYAVIAVFKVNPADFPYHKFISAAGQAEFDGYVSHCKALSFYDTGVTAQYGDKLITLSTCEYSTQGNRLVVVAQKIGGGSDG
ncbi:MAG: class B sortase [Oscillospiraceae bacterium]|jgi:sortase B|nr:class B sortase [Oscillospiraceae bacterium]